MPTDVASVTFHWTPEEAYRASRLLVPRWVTASGVITSLVILVAGIALLASGDLVVGSAAVVGGVVGIAARPVVRRRDVQKMAHVLAAVPEPLTVKVGPEGVRGSQGSTTDAYPWEAIASVAVVAEFVVVKGRPKALYIVPTRAFQGSGDIDGFVALADAYLAASREAGGGRAAVS